MSANPYLSFVSVWSGLDREYLTEKLLNMIGDEDDLLEDTYIPSTIALSLDEINDRYTQIVQAIGGPSIDGQLTDEQLAVLGAIDQYVTATVALSVRVAMYKGIGELLQRSESRVNIPADPIPEQQQPARRKPNRKPKRSN